MAFIPFVGGIWLIVLLVGDSSPQGMIYDRPTA